MCIQIETISFSSFLKSRNSSDPLNIDTMFWFLNYMITMLALPFAMLAYI